MAFPSASLNSEFEYITEHDDALDTEAEDFAEKWQRYRDGMDKPPLRDGKEPARFTLRYPPKRVAMRIAGLASNQRDAIESYYEWFRYGVKGLANQPGIELEFERDKTAISHLTDECVEQFPTPVILDVGRAVMMHANPSRD